MGDAGAAELEDGLFLGPVFGEGADGIVALLDDAAFLLVHGVTQQAVADLTVAFDVDANGLVGNGYGDAVFAVADVEMDLWMVGKERLAVFVIGEAERMGEASLLQ